jgi:hypothetical protein
MRQNHCDCSQPTELNILDDLVNRSDENNRSEFMGWGIGAGISDQAAEVVAAAEAEASSRQGKWCSSLRVRPVTAARGPRERWKGTGQACNV